MNHGRSAFLSRSFFSTVLITEAIQHVFSFFYLISTHIAVTRNRIRSNTHDLTFSLLILYLLRAVTVDLDQETVVHGFRLPICLVDRLTGIRDVDLRSTSELRLSDRDTITPRFSINMSIAFMLFNSLERFLALSLRGLLDLKDGVEDGIADSHLKLVDLLIKGVDVLVELRGVGVRCSRRLLINWSSFCLLGLIVSIFPWLIVDIGVGLIREIGCVGGEGVDGDFGL